jgi:hypothetical protein
MRLPFAKLVTQSLTIIGESDQQQTSKQMKIYILITIDIPNAATNSVHEKRMRGIAK